MPPKICMGIFKMPFHFTNYGYGVEKTPKEIDLFQVPNLQ